MVQLHVCTLLQKAGRYSSADQEGWPAVHSVGYSPSRMCALLIYAALVLPQLVVVWENKTTHLFGVHKMSKEIALLIKCLLTLGVLKQTQYQYIVNKFEMESRKSLDEILDSVEAGRPLIRE